MDVIPRVSPPTAFLRIDDGWATGTFQPGFVQGPVRYLIGVRDGLGRQMEYHADALDWREGTIVELIDVRIELSNEGRVVVWDRHHTGHVLWSSPMPTNRPSYGTPLKAVLDRKSGQLHIQTATTPPEILWQSTNFTRNTGYETSNHDPVLMLSDTVPYICIKDGGSTLFAAQSEWRHFDLLADDFIAVLPSISARDRSDQAPPIPHASRPMSLHDALSNTHIGQPQDTSRQTSESTVPLREDRTIYLWLNPNTSQLVLHTSEHPRQLEKSAIIWKSPNWKEVVSDPTSRSKATLQS